MIKSIDSYFKGQKNGQAVITMNKLPLPLKYRKIGRRREITFDTSTVTYKATNYLPLKLVFMESKIASCYIAQVARVGSISGTKIVKYILKLLKKFECPSAYLDDQSSIECEGISVPFSLLRILGGGSSFYEKFGFKRVISDFSFISEDELQTYLKKLRAVKIADVKKKYLKCLDLIVKSANTGDVVMIEDVYLRIQFNSPAALGDITSNILTIIDIFDTYDPDDKNTFGDLFLAMYKKRCSDFDIIEKFVLNGAFYRFVLNNNEVKFPFKKYYMEIDRVLNGTCYYKIEL